MPQRTIEELSTAECFRLLREEKVGRFVFQDADGPAAVPVNFGVAGEQVVFRLEQHSHLHDKLNRPVAFEVDRTDTKTGEGWSVLIRGAAQEIPMERVPALLQQMGESFPRPWAEGLHNAWMLIAPQKVTGRRLTTPYFAAIF